MRLIDADALKDNMFHYAAPEMMWDRGDIEHKINEMPTIDAIPVEATAKRLQRAFFSDSWEAWAEWLRGNYSDKDFAAHMDGKKDAIPVEWLRNICAIPEMETEDKICIDWLIQMWQKEQEAR